MDFLLMALLIAINFSFLALSIKTKDIIFSGVTSILFILAGLVLITQGLIF
jgi:hypothetical protein